MGSFITNDEVLDRAKSTDIEIILIRNGLRWMGHVARMPDERPAKALLYGVLEEGSMKIGRPLLRYKDTLRDILKRGAALGTWREIVTDRLAWRRLTSDICDKIEIERWNRNIERGADSNLESSLRLTLVFTTRFLVFICNFFVYYSYRVIGVYIYNKSSHFIGFKNREKPSIFCSRPSQKGSGSITDLTSHSTVN